MLIIPLLKIIILMLILLKTTGNPSDNPVYRAIKTNIKIQIIII